MRPLLDFETYSEAGHVWDAADRKWRALPNASQGKKGLPVVGARVYCEHPTAEVLCLAYNLGAGRRFWRPGMPDPVDLWAHALDGRTLDAWNSAFEFYVWQLVCVRRYLWPPLPPRVLECAMGRARSWGLPGSLDLAGKVVGAAALKDARGKALLDKFSVPRNPTQADPRVRVLPVWRAEDVEVRAARYAQVHGGTLAKWRKTIEADHIDTLALGDYCLQDTDAEEGVSAHVPLLPPRELDYWRDDQTINRRGVRVDQPLLDACIAVIEQASARYHTELHALTGVDAATKVAQLQTWLHGQGVHLDSLDEDAVEAALKGALPPAARRALEIRAAVGAGSVKKVYAMRNMLAADGRLHDLYVWSGARTGRPTGSGPQPTNLPKAGPPTVRCGVCGKHHDPKAEACPWCRFPAPPGRKSLEWSPAAMEDAISALLTRSLDYVEHVFGAGNGMSAVAGVLRGLFAAEEGCDLVSSDFTAIEGVVIACIAGERWRVDAFAADRSLYLESASRAFHIPIEDMERHKEETGQHHPMRQIGKGMELGLGFGGWVNALRQFDVDGTDDELKGYVLAWRDASPAIAWFWGGQKLRWELFTKTPGAPHDPWMAGWTREEARFGKPCMYGLEGAAISAILNPGHTYPVHRLDGSPTGISYRMESGTLYCTLLSGRAIAYHRARVYQHTEEWRGLGIEFEGYNTNVKNGPVGWITMKTYGGRLAENVVQATARDIQMHAINNCERAGYPVVLHTYDEIVAEIPEGRGSVEELERLMCDTPEWAKGWPVKAAGGWRAKRYRKG